MTAVAIRPTPAPVVRARRRRHLRRVPSTPQTFWPRPMPARKIAAARLAELRDLFTGALPLIGPALRNRDADHSMLEVLQDGPHCRTLVPLAPEICLDRSWYNRERFGGGYAVVGLKDGSILVAGPGATQFTLHSDRCRRCDRAIVGPPVFDGAAMCCSVPCATSRVTAQERRAFIRDLETAWAESDNILQTLAFKDDPNAVVWAGGPDLPFNLPCALRHPCVDWFLTMVTREPAYQAEGVVGFALVDGSEVIKARGRPWSWRSASDAEPVRAQS